jgi:general stress protein 26
MNPSRSSETVPRRIRPKFPKEWQVPNKPKFWITWAHATGKVRREEVYWVSTASRKGRPHAVPVWGIWYRSRFFFETAPDSVKARNIGANPRVVVHLQDGYDTVIVEGKVQRELDQQVLSRLRAMYASKYDYTPDWSDPQTQVVYRVDPAMAHAWKSPRMHRSMVKFVF